MVEQLRPDGTALIVGDVVIYSPGLAGTVEVYQPGTPGMRAAEDASASFLAALAATDVREQLTVEIDDPVAMGGGGGTRAGESDDVTVEVPGPGEGFGQLLLHVAPDGAVTWHLPVDVPTDQVAQRGGDRRTYVVPGHHPTAAPPAAGQRGLLGIAGKKLLKLLVFPLVDKVVGQVADHFARRWELTHRPPRLRSFTVDDYTLPVDTALGPADWTRLAEGPALMWIHGTSSRAHTGFARVPPELLATMHARYSDRVFAFDHPTIGSTPTENAQWLAEQIPDEVHLEVDVIAHSRGGLVGRVLAEHAAEVGLVGKLTVRRLVFVATPNAGTVLADSRNWMRLLDGLTNLTQLIPSNPVTDTVEVVLTVLKQLAVGAFAGLDGIRSMDPRGDYLLQFLNRPGMPQATGAYYAVASNFEPAPEAPMSTVLRDAGIDLVFRPQQNDLIVPTEGVYTVSEMNGFPIGAPVVFTSARAVDHSSYWTQPEFAEAVDAWLTG
jgi:hypothetical protein